MQQQQRGAQARDLGTNPQDAQEIQKAAHQLVPIRQLPYRGRVPEVTPDLPEHDQYVLQSGPGA
jgi:hypothetical protein